MAIELVAFDLDGTLVRGRTCQQVLGAAIGRSEESERLESLPIRDRTEAVETMADWLREHAEQDLLQSLDGLQFAPGCFEALDLLRARGVATAIVSLTWSFAVDWVAERVGADYRLGSRLTATGIELVWPADKGTWLRGLTRELGPEHGQVAAVGDSPGDLELLEAAGIRVYVGARAPELPGVVHLPGGDLHEIAARILAPVAAGEGTSE